MTTINPIDYFQTESTAIDLKFDFNNDGNVDINDYHYLELLNNDDDSTNDPYQVTDSVIQTTFASMIQKEKQNNEYTTLTTENVNEYVSKSLGEIANPNDATTLKELQNIGASLTQYIRNCSTASGLLSTVITDTTKEVEDLKTQQETEELKYTRIAAQVQQKEEEIASQTKKIIQDSITMSEQYKTACDATVKRCVKDYINGSYYGANLEEVIAQELYKQNFDTSPLENAQQETTYDGLMLSRMCDSLETLSMDIRTINNAYNSKNSLLKTSVTNRNTVLANGKTASSNYAQGYAVRTTLRNNLINNYHVEGSGDRESSENPQVQSLNDFLANNELNNMTYEDAWVVLQGAFDDCGITFDDENKKITVPYGNDTASHNIYSQLQEAINANFGDEVANMSEAQGYEDTEVTGGSITSTQEDPPASDPIGFTADNFTFEFVKDKNGDGIFNDKSEFVGSENGWEELLEYDTNNDGKISDDELTKLTVLKVNNENGQYTFESAAKAGISNIDLSSYKEANGRTTTNDYLRGTFELTYNGNIVEGRRTDDLNKNLDNNFAMVYSAQMKDLSGDYVSTNPFARHVDTVNTDKVVSDAESDILQSTFTSNAITSKAEDDVDSSSKGINIFVQEDEDETDSTENSSLLTKKQK